jgi:excinuclease ABC subunit C
LDAVVDGTDVLRRASTLLPPEPGVYRFRDGQDRVIYLGRATELRSRVRSYAGDLGRRRHLRRMVPQISRVEAIVCASVPEAGWLERNLLQRSMPRWNRIRGGMELVGWLVVSDDPGRPGLALVVEGAAHSNDAFGPYLGVERLALARSALLRAWPVQLAGLRLDAADRSMAEARGVSPVELAAYARQVRAVLSADRTAISTLHGLLAAASARAVTQLAFETARQIQSETAALDWLVAPQRVTGCSPGLRLGATADGIEFCLWATADRLDRWTSTRTGAQPGATPETPAEWREFALRNAALAAALDRVR